jgi:hypothetical protein
MKQLDSAKFVANHWNLMRIRDGKNSDQGWKKFESGINIPDPQHWNLPVFRIRILIVMALVDPGPYWGQGSESRSKEINIHLIFSLSNDFCAYVGYITESAPALLVSGYQENNKILYFQGGFSAHYLP